MRSPAPLTYPGKITRRPPTELRLPLLFEAGFAVHGGWSERLSCVSSEKWPSG
jgi:hypothetical protein